MPAARRFSRYDAKGFFLKRKPAAWMALLEPFLKKTYALFEIGRGGFGFLSKRPFPPGMTFGGKIHTVLATRPIEVVAEVRWVKLLDKPEEGCRYRVGARFLEVKERGREDLLKVLASEDMEIRVTYVLGMPTEPPAALGARDRPPPKPPRR